ncbi:FtsX-like permease family protein [Candidatus Peregrinibacteria bacterium]|nr:FtsX-like permease family protein [Candidatus Peregrinibacteria bacterium]
MIENPLVEATAFKDYYIKAGYTKENTVEIWSEAIGTAVDDVNDTMQALGDIIGGIGLMVGGITIFILIFVNAVSKRRFIGILKASGINTGSIILSYVFQGLWYTMIAIGIGLIILYGFLVPYIDRNPIDFPFADGILYVPWDYVFARLLVLVVVSMVSGFVPAYLIARENTLNAILGR